MAKLFNRAWMTVSGTPGTGTITLGAALSNAYLTFAEAGVANTNVVAYVIEDGTDFEIGIGTYTSSGTTLSRDTVTASKIGGTAGTTKLTLTSAATVFLCPRKEEIFNNIGTTTNDEAAAGNVGEFQSHVVAVGSAVSLTTATPANVCQLSLTAGDWEVQFFPLFNPNAATNVTGYVSDITTTSATVGTSGTDSRNDWFYAVGLVAYFTPLIAGPSRRLLSATTTVYGVVRGTFTINTLTCYGTMTARRIR